MNILRYIRLVVAAISLPSLLCVMSCEDTDYMTFDTDNSGIYFTKDTLVYSFGVTPVEVKTYTYNIPVRIMGPLSDNARPIGYKIVAEETNAQEGVHYTIGEALILPDSINGYIPVTIYRSALEGTYQEGYTRYGVRLQLIKNDYFSPMLSTETSERYFYFDNAIDQPAWYNAHGEKVWQESYLGVWHPLKFIKMVEYFHAIEEILPDTYEKMVKLYGADLEHIPEGNPYVYKTIFIKYIYGPMYEYFSAPENRDAILEEYPDFMFDFPDPYSVQ